MAELLDQSEIDDLLNSNLGEDLFEQEDEYVSEKTPRATKIFKSPKKVEFRFKYNYRSPVIKRNDIIYNPNSKAENNNGKVIVRDLINYAAFLRERNIWEKI